MGLSIFLPFLALCSMCYVHGFKIDFGGGKYAFYKLEPSKNLSGGEAFVKMARVLECYGDFEFTEGQLVALKIAWFGLEEDLKREGRCYDFIKNSKKKIEGIAKVDGVGVSDDLVIELNLPLENTEMLLTILVMQPLGRDLEVLMQTYSTGVLPPGVLVPIHNKLTKILLCLEEINFVHGDVKPPNVLLDLKNDVSGEFSIYLTDFGFSVIDKSKTVKVTGDIFFKALALMEENAGPPTFATDKESKVFTITYLACNNLPWLKQGKAYQKYLDENPTYLSTEVENLCEPIKILKKTFDVELFARAEQIPKDVQEELKQTLLEARVKDNRFRKGKGPAKRQSASLPDDERTKNCFGGNPKCVMQ